MERVTRPVEQKDLVNAMLYGKSEMTEGCTHGQHRVGKDRQEAVELFDRGLRSIYVGPLLLGNQAGKSSNVRGGGGGQGGSPKRTLEWKIGLLRLGTRDRLLMCLLGLNTRASYRLQKCTALRNNEAELKMTSPKSLVSIDIEF